MKSNIFSLSLLIILIITGISLASNVENITQEIYQEALQSYETGDREEARDLLKVYLKRLDLDEIFTGKQNLTRELPALVEELLSETEIQEIIYQKAGIDLKEEVKKANLYIKDGKYYINFKEVELEELIREVEIELEKSVEEIDLGTALELEGILIKDSNIKNLSNFKFFINLNYFHLENVKIKNWVNLKYFRRMNSFIIIDGGLEDISFLNDLSDTVEYLFLSCNNIKELSSISHLKYLRTLDISYNEIEDLSPLKKLGTHRMDVLLLNNNNLKTLRGLEGLKIRRLNVAYNPLSLEGIEVIEKLNLSKLKIDRKVFDGVVFAKYPGYIFVDNLEFVEEDENE